MGSIYASEVLTEARFLLIETLLNDCSCWYSYLQGIFGTLRGFTPQSFHHVLAVVARSWRRVCCCFAIELCERCVGCSYGRVVLVCYYALV
jgi:hypothetical protein